MPHTPSGGNTRGCTASARQTPAPGGSDVGAEPRHQTETLGDLHRVERSPFQELVAALPEEGRERLLGWSSPYGLDAGWQGY